MTTALKQRIHESSRPVGNKKLNNWKLPSEDFAYGRKEKGDPEGAGISV